MKMIIKENILLWTALMFFILIGILFYYTRNLIQQNQELIQDQTVISTPSSMISPESLPSDPAVNAVRVIEDTKAHTTIRYENGVFQPREITVTQEIGCFVAIENKSNEDVIPRLGPYDTQKEKGFLYQPISPGHTGFIDPRYATTTYFSFYNKNKPEADFLVYIDLTCL